MLLEFSLVGLPLFRRNAMKRQFPAFLAHSIALVDTQLFEMTLGKISQAKFAVLLPVPVGRHLQQALETLLTIEKRPFGFFSARDIDTKSDDAAIGCPAIGYQQPRVLALQKLIVALVGVQMIFHPRAHIGFFIDIILTLESAPEIGAHNVRIG